MKNAEISDLLIRARPAVVTQALLSSAGTPLGDEARALLFDIDQAIEPTKQTTEERREWIRRWSLRALFGALDETAVGWPSLATVEKWVETSDGPFTEAYDELRLWLKQKHDRDSNANREIS